MLSVLSSESAFNVRKLSERSNPNSLNLNGLTWCKVALDDRSWESSKRQFLDILVARCSIVDQKRPVLRSA